MKRGCSVFLIVVAIIAVLCVVSWYGGCGGKASQKQATGSIIYGYVNGFDGNASPPGVMVFEIRLWAKAGDVTVAGQRSVGILQHATRVEMLGRADGYVKVKSGTLTGWVPESLYSTSVMAKAYPVTAYVDVTAGGMGAPVYFQPYDVVDRLSRGMKVTRFDCADGMCRIGVPGHAETLWIADVQLSSTPP